MTGHVREVGTAGAGERERETASVVEGGPESVDGGGTTGPERKAGAGSRVYLLVWGLLAALTLVEVWIAGVGLGRQLTILVLIGLALWKAALVALYYMHLRFEPARLWVLALAPLPLPVILVLAVLQEF